jgi:predicted Zn finger-like uncharacterized protein
MQTTHCPNCATHFKVTPDQLRQANGWVRCGRCQCVFEALIHMTPPLKLKDAPQKPAVMERQGLWLLASLGFVLLLILQWAWVGRHLLYTQISALRPALHAMCETFHCEVTWPRSPEAVVIESSSFSEAPGGGYVVNLRLRNTATFAIATPVLELSLMDLQDQVVVRRVVTQAELGLADHLLPLREVRAQVHFDLQEDANEGITGFRAFIFYP